MLQLGPAHVDQLHYSDHYSFQTKVPTYLCPLPILWFLIFFTQLKKIKILWWLCCFYFNCCYSIVPWPLSLTHIFLSHVMDILRWVIIVILIKTGHCCNEEEAWTTPTPFWFQANCCGDWEGGLIYKIPSPLLILLKSEKCIYKRKLK